MFPLLADGSLRVECAQALAPLLRRWLPLLPYDQTAAAPSAATIRIQAGDPTRVAPAAAGPSLYLGATRAHLDVASGRATLHAASGCAGVVELDAVHAEYTVPPFGEGEAEGLVWDLYGMCTLGGALLLGRLGRALVHAAAVVAPDGGAWLLAGDTHAGKSTTCVSLITAGWRFVSDDHVVLFRGAGGELAVEGWPRRFHLDQGWEHGRPGMARGEIDPHQRWPGQWLRSAPLAGLLFPRVEAGLPTELSPIPGAEALTALLRQSPWLLGDRARAPEILAFLRSTCERPTYALRLGLDTYRDTERLVQVLQPLTDRR
ncbi:MAG TPA: hypothetical protein VFS20_27530 [Longimicrobium sp.]|nr:hypothetical protein [Longimicrobium sp.]